MRAAHALFRRSASQHLVTHEEEAIPPGATVIVPATRGAAFEERRNIRALIIADPETVPQRVAQRIDVPGLAERRADIPLLTRQILVEWTMTEAKAMARHIGPQGEPKLSVDLMRHLLGMTFQQNERSLKDILWESVETSQQPRLMYPKATANVRQADWETEFDMFRDTI